MGRLCMSVKPMTNLTQQKKLPTSDQLKEFKRIVEDAPDGMSVAIYNRYAGDWLYTNQENLKSLDDLRTIIAQADEIERLRQGFNVILHSCLLYTSDAADE